MLPLHQKNKATAPGGFPVQKQKDMKAVKFGIIALVLIFAAAGVKSAVMNHYRAKYHELGMAACKAGNVEFSRFYDRYNVTDAKTYAVALDYFYQTQKKY